MPSILYIKLLINYDCTKVPSSDQPFIHDVIFFGVIDRHDEKIYKPSQRILVHRLDVCQVSNGEE